MGNRGGVLHNDNREVVRQYAGRRWITCLLEFKSRRRTVMSPNRYTELFFLDEAVALAAGHRPCAECRRDRSNAFKEAWAHSKDLNGTNLPLVDQIDRELHSARIDNKKRKLTYQTSLRSLPAGCFVQIESSSYLVWGDTLLLWSPQGYLKKQHRPSEGIVTVLTPEPMVRCLRQGYRPEIHESARALRVPGGYNAMDGAATELQPILIDLAEDYDMMAASPP
jgi:hypothetical protein